MIKKFIGIVSLVLLMGIAAEAQLISPPKTPAVVKTPKITYNNFYTVSTIHKQLLGPGTYETEGFVGYIYTCPSCPPEGVCKPCMGNNIVITEDNKTFDGYNYLTDKELIVFTDESQALEKGIKYKFLIQVLDVKTVDQALNNIKLIYSEKLEAPQKKNIKNKSATLVK